MSAPSAWGPLGVRAFRALWLAALVGLTGAWFQTVGAQWLLVHRPHASILVSLVQTVTTLPYVLFGLVAGVLADTLDRRLLLVGVQATIAATGAVLAVLTFAHLMPPALLLVLVFLLGTGAALGTPAYQSLVPDLVPRARARPRPRDRGPAGRDRRSRHDVHGGCGDGRLLRTRRKPRRVHDGPVRQPGARRAPLRAPSPT
jgi:MFS family permease